MSWYYAENGRQTGPIDDAQLEALAREGRILFDTLVWREGMTEWQPYGQVRASGAVAAPPSTPVETGVPPVAAPAEGVICSECGRAFSPNDVIRYNDKWICAACKPTFFQRLREGAVLPSAGASPAATEADLLARDYEVDIGGCLSQAWELFKANAGELIGATVLVGLMVLGVGMALSMTSSLLGVAIGVPYLNLLSGLPALLIVAPLMAGLWLFYIKKVRKLEANTSTVFRGFGPRYRQLVLVQLIPTLMSIVVSAAVFALMGGVAASAVILGGGRSRGSFPALSPALLVPVGIIAVVGGVVWIYLSVCWRFALPLVADKGLKFWPALQLSRRVVSKHWWMTLWLLVVYNVLTSMGIMCCFVGALVTAPAAFGMLSYHYQKVFGDLMPSES